MLQRQSITCILLTHWDPNPNPTQANTVTPGPICLRGGLHYALENYYDPLDGSIGFGPTYPMYSDLFTGLALYPPFEQPLACIGKNSFNFL